MSQSFDCIMSLIFDCIMSLIFDCIMSLIFDSIMWKSIWMDTAGIIIFKLKGRMNKGGHYYVEMKGWMDG